jgi:hypothetical protein
MRMFFLSSFADGMLRACCCAAVIAAAAGALASCKSSASATCSAGKTDCGAGFCADLQSDPFHCGYCQNPCPQNATCEAGKCKCPGTHIICGVTCVDAQTDAYNCAVCGHVCGLGSCSAGICFCSGSTDCGVGESPQCVDTTTDPSNCGGCANVCLAHEVCQASACQCPAPYTRCDTGAGHVCTDTLTDPSNCGGCGSAFACQAGWSCTHGLCNNNGASPGGNTITPPGPSVPNVVAVTVDAGPLSNYVNGIFADVTVCVPGTGNCQTIDHVLVDTGSMGLRLLSNGASEGGELSLGLPAVTNANSMPVAECTQFFDGFVWGPVRRADVKMASETAANIPVQVISKETYTLPGSCTGINESTLAALGANGIIGIGFFVYDCGDSCTPGTTMNPGMYYSCPGGSGSCQIGTLTLSSQVVNPVAKFAVDNNGTIIELPTIDSSGSSGVSGSLVFGIDTQFNNQLGTSMKIPADECGNFTTTFGGTEYPNAYMDSGSNAIFYLSAALLASKGLHACSSNNGFYCTAAGTTSPVAQTATLAAQSGQSGQVNFGIADESALLNTSFVAFDDLGGSLLTSFSCATGKGGGPTFDWGLAFFFGRNIYTAIENPSAPGVGLYVAYN